MAKNDLCAIDGCGKPRHAYGYCNRHVWKFVKYGDPLAGRTNACRGEALRWIKEHARYGGDDCIPWPFEVSKTTGYGIVHSNGRRRNASRVMCEEAHGPAPSSKHDAAHSCGNGDLACMNRNHLRWATKIENSADAKRHGTWNHGESVPSSVLTRDQVIEIRRIGRTLPQQDIADRFGVRDSTISRILAGKRWGWMLDGEPKL
jgi:hypothetical protein